MGVRLIYLLAPLLITTPHSVGVSDTIPCWGAGLILTRTNQPKILVWFLVRLAGELVPCVT